MSRMETKQLSDNELIAEFMGCQKSQFSVAEQNAYYINPSDSIVTWVNEMEYHTSWDWLMPVVQKAFDTEFGDNFEQWQKYNKKICEALASVNIEAVYKAVVEFIKWYTSNQPQ